MSNECRIGIMKLGCIGAAPLLDLLLDERAERKDIDVVTVGSGAKLDAEPCKVAATKMSEYDVGLVIIVSPNAALPGPTEARNMILEKGIPVLTISDGPSKKAFYKKNDQVSLLSGFEKLVGYIQH